ncbi:hypothetical protein EVAR_23193_1 [Eumeta japonica]|uniref:Uncharacterized protein n=1 Tax=Eumeta variegata TaxID=151549 RepID=A0A4C1VDG4_EUMVA|nr:hypothetical protein EVAR_23193_1 [Eumeta japonica]
MHIVCTYGIEIDRLERRPYADAFINAELIDSLRARCECTCTFECDYRLIITVEGAVTGIALQVSPHRG